MSPTPRSTAIPPSFRATSLLAAFAASLGSALAQSVTPSAPPAPEPEAYVELSPFQVDASQDVGYRSAATLAGSRLNTQLSDVAGAISIFNRELLTDLAAGDVGSLLTYAVSTEVGGYLGNFSEGTGEQQNARGQPQTTQRVRGLTNASNTRNFFLTDIPFDSYNTDRVTVSRGANSLLFGIGSAGGILDNSLASASRGKNTREVSLQLGRWGHYRASANINQVLVPDRVGLRVALLKSDRQYPQRPAYEDTERWYVALNALLRKGEGGVLGDTTFLANFEKGDIVSERPQNSMNSSTLEWFFNAPDPARYAPFGLTVPASRRPGTFVPKYTFDNRAGTPANPPAIIGRIQQFNASIAVFYDENGLARMFPDSPGVSAIRGFDVPLPALGLPRYDYLQTSEFRPGAPFQIRGGRALPYEIFDNRKQMLIAGGLTSFQEFDALNVTVQQELFNRKGGLEYAFDTQEYFNVREEQGVNSILGWITVDVNQYLTDGSPNPNVGRPFVRTHFVGSRLPDAGSTTERESHRVTAYYELDLGDKDGWLRHLGRHRFTGVRSEQEFNTLSRSYTLYWSGPTRQQIWRNAAGQPLSFAAQGPAGDTAVMTNIYVGPSLLDPSIRSLEDVRLRQTRATPLRAGDSFIARYRNPVTLQLEDQSFTATPGLNAGNRTRETIDSTILAWQGFLLDDHIVGLLGWREDHDIRFGRIGGGLLPDGTLDPAQALVMGSAPQLDVTGRTVSKSVVARLPDRWNPLSERVRLSAHWGESENFSPGDVRRNVLNQQLPAITGDTREHGFSVETPNRRFGVRFNWFTTGLKNQNSIGVGGTNNFFGFVRGQLQAIIDYQNQGGDFNRLYDYAFQDLTGPRRYGSFTELQNAMIGLINGPAGDLFDLRVVNGSVLSNNIDSFNISDTRDVVSKGFEVDLSGQIARGWNVAFNVARQNVVVTNVLPTWAPYIFDAVEQSQAAGFWQMYTNGWSNLIGTGPAPAPTTRGFQANFFSTTINNVTNRLATEGTSNPEVREWRANLISSYAFSNESRLKGWTVGGALRWQDKVALGYPQALDPTDGLFKPVISSPYFGDSELNGDAWISYRFRLFDSYDCRVQLNARNIIGSQDAIPVRVAPDGVVDVVRNPPAREFLLTTTVNF